MRRECRWQPQSLPVGLKRREEEMDLINATEGKFRLFLHPLYYTQDKYRHINIWSTHARAVMMGVKCPWQVLWACRQHSESVPSSLLKEKPSAATLAHKIHLPQRIFTNTASARVRVSFFKIDFRRLNNLMLHEYWADGTSCHLTGVYRWLSGQLSGSAFKIEFK